MKYEKKTIQEIMSGNGYSEPAEIVGVPRGVVISHNDVVLFYLDSSVNEEDRKSEELPSRFLRVSYNSSHMDSDRASLFAESAIRTASETRLPLVVRGSLSSESLQSGRKLTFIAREFVFKDNHVYAERGR